MNKENCPCCPNHCEKDNLSCGRGRDYFNNGNKNIQEPQTINEQVIMDLRKCGHKLHHNKDINPNAILSNLSNEELESLHNLLTKINN